MHVVEAMLASPVSAVKSKQSCRTRRVPVRGNGATATTSVAPRVVTALSLAAERLVTHVICVAMVLGHVSAIYTQNFEKALVSASI
jgi:hypothetical protein